MDHSLRSLTVRDGLVDFASNDYLGFARSEYLRRFRDKAAKSLEPVSLGSTGSRLLSGNSHLAEDLEQELASFHGAEAALLFNSGYEANLGLVSALSHRHVTVIFDEYVHASIRDGARLGLGRSYSFRHNDPEDLERKLSAAKGPALVLVEALYSMDGDLAPLDQILDVCKRYAAELVVDEAHTNGLYGDRGQGLVAEKRLEGQVFARVVTFGKALGCHGAAVLGSSNLVKFLVNFARPFIYTTALPASSLISIKSAYGHLPGARAERAALRANIDKFNDLFPGRNCTGPVQSLVVGGNERTRRAAQRMVEHGLDVRALLSPTVPAGTERLRICLHAFNTAEELHRLALVLREELATLEMGLSEKAVSNW
ncbi:MAG: aminotransferase class I/II-fold pyridoxal phosphate-dependent enzyme [Oligoflexia bacterium]|nr:aminotransferase class I/II-fold pyridoxal phosphate-dependent enzyme [Oligoflexia bacterium]